MPADTGTDGAGRAGDRAKRGSPADPRGGARARPTNPTAAACKFRRARDGDDQRAPCVGVCGGGPADGDAAVFRCGRAGDGAWRLEFGRTGTGDARLDGRCESDAHSRAAEHSLRERHTTDGRRTARRGCAGASQYGGSVLSRQPIAPRPLPWRRRLLVRRPFRRRRPPRPLARPRPARRRRSSPTPTPTAAPPVTTRRRHRRRARRQRRFPQRRVPAGPASTRGGGIRKRTSRAGGTSWSTSARGTWCCKKMT